MGSSCASGDDTSAHSVEISRDGALLPPLRAFGRYAIRMSEADFLGEGSSSVVYRGKDVQTGEPAAVKLYKLGVRDGGRAAAMKKFARQVAVLSALRDPFSDAAQASLPPDVEPHDVFVRLLSCSLDSSGRPGPDVVDGSMWIALELAGESLLQSLEKRASVHCGFPKERLRQLARDICLVGACLHAKGFVHLDLKPENLLLCDGRLKLIDVDGCQEAGSLLEWQDTTISFSSVYCAPEWARFVVDPERKPVVVEPSMDVWSVGMTISELVLLRPALSLRSAEVAGSAMRSTSKSRARSSTPSSSRRTPRRSSSKEPPSHRRPPQPRVLQRTERNAFLEWLREVPEVPVPKAVLDYDTDLAELLQRWLLVLDPQQRRKLADCLRHPFLRVPYRAHKEDLVESEPTATGGDSAIAEIDFNVDEEARTDQLFGGLGKRQVL